MIVLRLHYATLDAAIYLFYYQIVHKVQTKYCIVLYCTVCAMILISEVMCISEGCNAVASTRLSVPVCLSVCLFPLYLQKQLTVHLELCMRVSFDHS